MPVVLYHPEYGAYAFDADHPFSPLRIEMVLDLLHEAGVPVELVAPESATQDELATVHDSAYLGAVADVSRSPADPRFEYGLGTQDNPMKAGMDLGAARIAGGTLTGARMIAEGKASKVLQMGGGLHHARAALASGFCLFNDLAIAIRDLTSRGLHVAYLDVDVHHGDGVQSIFFDDDHVLTLSLHESGEYLFPGSGWTHELGRGMGRGFKLNVPLEPFTEGDNYLEVLDMVAQPALEYFRPDVLVVQAGADAHFADPLADLLLTTQTYEALFRRILTYADRFSAGRLLLTLGGGYSLEATPRIWTILYLVLFGYPIFENLPAAWIERWRKELGPDPPRTLHDPPHPYETIPRREEINRHNRLMAQRLLDAVSMLWL
ncbi:MAG: acetoin utilization protein AcuC [Acidobacteria bacterium]|nr:acetoin utilization protein AcuC [Acidobacteriota bacterium]